MTTTAHPKTFCAREGRISEIEMAAVLRGLRQALAAGDETAARQLLARRVEGEGLQEAALART